MEENLTPLQIDYRDRLQMALGTVTDEIKECLEKEVDVSNPDTPSTANMMVTVRVDIVGKYLKPTGYSENISNFINQALSLAYEFAYLNDFYQNFNKDTPAEDFTLIDSLQACVNEQKENYGLDRTEQIGKYQKLPELKRKFQVQKQFEFNEAEIEANELIDELRKDIADHYGKNLFNVDPNWVLK